MRLVRPIAALRRRPLYVPIGAGVVLVGVSLVLGLSSAASFHRDPLIGMSASAPARPMPRGPDKAGHTQFTPAPAAVRLAAAMPLERQVAQVFAVTLTGPSPADVKALGGLPWGGVIFGAGTFRSDAQISALARSVGAAVRQAGRVAPLLAVSQEGGQSSVITDLPPQSEAAIGAVGNPVVAQSEALLTGRRLRALGFDMTLAPLVDVGIEAGPLGDRVYGTDPATVTVLGYAAVQGYTAAGLISAPGHFPGSGAASADPDQMTATVGGPLSALRTRDLIPFATIVRKAPVMLMSNALYAAFDGVTPASLLKPAIHLLRQNYNYEGVVMSDDLDAAVLATGGSAGANAITALRAGDDLLYLSGSPAEQRAAYDEVLAAARQSATLRRRIHGATLRVLTLKAHFGVVR